MKYLHDKRVGFGIASAVFTVTVVACFLTPPEVKLQGVGIGIIVALLASLAAVRYSFTVKGFWRPLPILFLLVISSFFFSYFYQNLNIKFILFLSVFSGALNYIMLLASNVFVVSVEKGSDIPLTAPARTFMLLLCQHIIFISSVIIFKVPVPFYVQLPVFFITIFILAKSNFSLQKINQRFLWESFFVAMFLSQAYFCLAFVRTEDIFRALVLVAGFYVCTNAFETLANFSFRKKQVLEYVGIFLALAVMILFV